MYELKVYMKQDSFSKIKNETNVISIVSKVVELYGEESDYARTEINSTRMTLKNDGAIVLNDEDHEGYIYLYPEQVKHLKYLLDQIK